MKQDLRQLVERLSGFGSDRMQDVGIPAFAFVMFVSLISAVFVAYLYLYFFSRRAAGSEIHRSFPLLAVSVTAIFVSIQFSLPLSLGLLGALSIVRFRTPIKEPEEIGFIMVVIATSITCATFNFVFLSILLIAALGACLLLTYGPSRLKEPLNDGLLVVTLTQTDYSTKYNELMKCLDGLLHRGRLESIYKTRDETVISYNFRALKQSTMGELQSRLEVLVGDASYNIFFNRAGTP